MMHYPHYRLSGRQRKQYAVRRGSLRIAIPLPLEWPDDATDDELADFFRRCLPEDILAPDHLRSIEELFIGVVPSSGGATSHRLGTIVMGEQTHNVTHLAVSVVIGTISVDANPRHPNAQIQWPGDVSRAFPSRPADPDNEDDNE
ncbi:hypothetical protein [Schlesneria sp. T3-172]|uniref:hypothetical protein n=1 Tax=Schlesneria sphaerica TaxID=3373610 RepID=UPI0037CA3FE8